VEKKNSKITKTGKDKQDPSYIVVAQDGTGDFIGIQAAINATKAFPYERITIFIKKGMYQEKIRVYEWNTMLSMIGESKDSTVITFNDYFDKINLGRNSTFHTPTVLVEANDFIAKNLTFENSAGEVGQAIALSVIADKVLIEDCNIIANQDALYTSGEGARQYYKNCYIEGTTDFIFGQATALFENCVIHSKINSYITAASTPKDIEFGYVFKHCRLTAAKNVDGVYLGRPWRIFAKTVFIDCEMGSHIKPEAWHNWDKTDAEKTTFYAEYHSTGLGGKVDKRASWSHQMLKEEADQYTLKNILGDSGWYLEK
jgi:pectinesterase